MPGRFMPSLAAIAATAIISAPILVSASDPGLAASDSVRAMVGGERATAQIPQNPSPMDLPLNSRLILAPVRGTSFFRRDRVRQDRYRAAPAAMVADAPFIDDYSSYLLTSYSNPPSSLLPLHGQFNTDDFALGTDLWLGAATDAIMQNIPAGAPGGVPPIGNLLSTGLPPGQYAALARRTGQDQTTSNFELGFRERFRPRIISPEQPMALSNDWYLQSAATNQWWSPVSFTAGGTPDRIFFGGTQIVGALALYENTNGVLDTFVSLGTVPGNSFIGAFYSPPRDPAFPFPVGQWFELMEMFTASTDGQTGRSLWVKTQETLANGFLDPRMASGDLLPTDNNPAGWLNIYPGMADDPNTAQREGLGLARNQYGQEAPTRGYLGQAVITYWSVLDGQQWGAGLDPHPSVVPDFLPDDAFVDNTVFTGKLYTRPDVLPDHLIPFIDGFELYATNTPLRNNTSQWAAGASSIAFVTPDGADQSLTQANEISYDILDTIETLDLPTPDLPLLAHAGAPIVASATLRLSSAPGATTHTIELDPATLNIVLGAVDPTDSVGAADGMVWIEQPNPNFNPNQEWQDHLVQRHWIPSAQWQTPPADAPLNTRYTLIPTGVAVPLGADFPVRIEIEPDAPASATNQLRVFIAGSEVFPNSDPLQHFVAPARAPTSLVFGTGANSVGAGDAFVIDDVSIDGPLLAPAAGPAFALPYVDGFESYPANETIDGQGATPFLSLASVPDGSFPDSLRRLTVIPDASAIPATGELVCRYSVDEVFLGSGLLTPGQIVAISFADLPAPYNTVSASSNDCPGDPSRSTAFTLRPGLNQPRHESGRWTVQFDPPKGHNSPTPNPMPFDPALGDAIGFRFDFFTDARWAVAGDNETIRIRPLSETLPGQGAGEKVMEIRSITPGAASNFPLFSSLNSQLPAARSTQNIFTNPGKTAQLSFDIYIESLDAQGAPDNTLPPRSRLAIPLVGAGVNGGRVTTLILGGPHVNESELHMNSNLPIEILPTDAISVAVPIANGTNPDSFFQSTGVSLLTGGAGLDGAIAGPLVNRWIRIFASVDANSMWTIRIDEDRDGPLNPVTIATGVALDLGDTGIGGQMVDTSSLDRFKVDQGFDIGSGGEPTTRTARIAGFADGAAAIAPPNANPNDDWCFYTVTHLSFLDNLNPPVIAQVDPNTGEVTSVAPLSPFDSGFVLAALNRRRDGANQVTGAKVHTHCPWDSATGVSQFDFFDPASGQLQASGKWELLGRVGMPGFDDPIPAGGLSVPDGPAQTPPIAYNDPSQAPADYSGVVEARSILLTEWTTDPSDGWDPSPPAFPQERWIVDNVELDAVSSGPNCANIAGDPTLVDGADLATLLVNWGPAAVGSTGDLNGDAMVNGADLAILLVNWGPCP